MPTRAAASDNVTMPAWLLNTYSKDEVDDGGGLAVQLRPEPFLGLHTLNARDLDALAAYANGAAGITCSRQDANPPHEAELGRLHQQLVLSQPESAFQNTLT